MDGNGWMDGLIKIVLKAKRFPKYIALTLSLSFRVSCTLSFRLCFSLSPSHFLDHIFGPFNGKCTEIFHQAHKVYPRQIENFEYSGFLFWNLCTRFHLTGRSTANASRQVSTTNGNKNVIKLVCVNSRWHNHAFRFALHCIPLNKFVDWAKTSV